MASAPARAHLFEGLRLGAEMGAVASVAFALPGIALLWVNSGHAERAVELYALASSMPLVGNSLWFKSGL
jgi:hypothetical protein